MIYRLAIIHHYYVTGGLLYTGQLVLNAPINEEHVTLTHAVHDREYRFVISSKTT